MYKYLVGVLFVALFVGAGCNVNLDTNGEEVIDSSPKTERIQQNDPVPPSNTATDTAETKKPQIVSASFDGNGVVIEGKNLSGSFVAFTTPSSKTLCKEMSTPNCVLQKTVSTDTTIKFISNLIGEMGTYQIYVENKTSGESNKVSFSISTSANSKLSKEAKEAMEAELKVAIAKEKGTSIEKMQVQINLQNGAFVRGMVSFEPGYGGIFFAVKQNGAWKIPYIGNGTISCSLKTEYGFPSTFLNDCVN
ncbi:MAG: hypothetical protein HYV41_00275 [Candidatus Magasanikbacteria bacterium]|nr:hypothetical protein [Candidatus Magasanikbacteria bacterium]